LVCAGKFMHFCIIGYAKQYRCAEPCGGFSKKYAVCKYQWQEKRNADPHKKFCNAADHGNEGISHSLKGGAVDIKKVKEKKSCALYV